MTKIECQYFSDEVVDFIDNLSISAQKKFFFAKEKLEEWGHRTPLPHAKYVRDDIFELRFWGKEGTIRVLYFFFDRNKAVFTNGFLKKSNKIPSREISVALQRKNVYLSKRKEAKNDH